MRDHGLATAGAADWQPTPAILLPEQFFGEGPEVARMLPDQRLGFAVLELAVFDFQRGVAAGGGRILREVERWLFSDDVSWAFSFRNLCDALDVDAPSLRRRLHRWRAARASGASGGLRRLRRIPVGRTRAVGSRRRRASRAR